MTRKIIQLTESDLKKIVKRIIVEQSFKVLVTPGNSPEGTIGLENNQKVLTITTQSGRTQKFVVNTVHPVNVKAKPVFIQYKGDNIFLLGPKKVEAVITKQLK